MSKTNDTSRLATLEDHDALADTQLDAVTGGMLGLENIFVPQPTPRWCPIEHVWWRYSTSRS